MIARDVPVLTYHLEITDPADLRPSTVQRPGFQILQAKDSSPELGHFLFTAIGGDWYWSSRLEWTWDRWMEHLDREVVELWVASIGGNTVGFYETEKQPKSTECSTEIVLFGLLNRYLGQGLGGILLTHAIRRGWETGSSRVWLHTCVADHPRAMAHYEARGMRVFKTENVDKKMGDAPPDPWPGAQRRPSPEAYSPSGSPRGAS